VITVDEYVGSFFTVSRESSLEDCILVENCGVAPEQPRGDLNVFFPKVHVQEVFKVLNTKDKHTWESFFKIFDKYPITVLEELVKSKKLTFSEVFLRIYGSWEGVMKNFDIAYCEEPQSEQETESVLDRLTAELSEQPPEELGNSEGAGIVIDFTVQDSSSTHEAEDEELPEEKVPTPLRRVASMPINTRQLILLKNKTAKDETATSLAVESFVSPLTLLETLNSGGPGVEQLINLLYLVANKSSSVPQEEICTEEEYKMFQDIINQIPLSLVGKITAKVIATMWVCGKKEHVSLFVKQFAALAELEEPNV
jgi:hypothetical protein